ncbi:acyltransferase [Desulfovibrio sp. An276]|uniref:acyltransferase n=1 Tax=Desulfovibrio sp. An276 TaxID=1965618 RepID=UPI001184DF40|nr:hypothetical protein [Desulfovibrio sp. An276]
MKSYNEYLSNINSKIRDIISDCKNILYNKDTINIYCINEDISISVVSNIPNVTLHDLDKGNGSIIIYYKGTNFINCHITLRKECVVIIGFSNQKINKLCILNNNGYGSICYIGSGFSCMGTEIRLWENKNVYIGDDVMFSWAVMLFTSDGHTIFNKYGEIINKPEDIIICDHVWVGHGVKILKGGGVNKNCVIGESSVVTKKFDDENVILSGVPAKIIKTGIMWDRRRLYKNPH